MRRARKNTERNGTWRRRATASCVLGLAALLACPTAAAATIEFPWEEIIPPVTPPPIFPPVVPPTVTPPVSPPVQPSPGPDKDGGEGGITSEGEGEWPEGPAPEEPGPDPAPPSKNAPLALGVVERPPADAHFTSTRIGEFTTAVPATVPETNDAVCAVHITALAGAGGNANDTTAHEAGDFKNGAGAAAAVNYPVRPGMQITGHVGQGGKHEGTEYRDPAFARDIAGFTEMVFGGNRGTSNQLRARASGGAPDGGFGGNMPGYWWGGIRHVGAGGGGSSAVSIAGEELVVVGGGGGNGGGHATNLGGGGDGGQVTGPGVAGIGVGGNGLAGSDNQWYQAHSDGTGTGRFNENLASSGTRGAVLQWGDRRLHADSAYRPSGGTGGSARPGDGGRHLIDGKTDVVIPVTGHNRPADREARKQKNSLLDGFSGAGRVGGSGGNDQVFFRGIDPVQARRSTGNPDTGGGGGGGYAGGGGGASTIGYGKDVHKNIGITGAGGGGGSSFVAAGDTRTASGVIGQAGAVEAGLGPKARSNSNGADGFVALKYEACGSVEKTVDLAPMSPRIVNETGEFARAGQLVKYTLLFRAPASHGFAVDHVDELTRVLGDADWVGDVRYGRSAEEAAAEQGPLSPGIAARFEEEGKRVRVTGTVPAGQIRTVSFTVRVKPSFPTRAAGGSGSGSLTNFLGETGTKPPAECEPGQELCTVNPLLGEVIWKKSAGDGKALSGSEWRLTGPLEAGSRAVEITDCVSPEASECPGADKDPRPGRFAVQALPWGSYSLTETRAPAGYLLDTATRSFRVGPGSGEATAHIAVDLGQIVNRERPALVIPLTGGAGADAFLVGGGGLLATLATLALARSRWLRRILRVHAAHARSRKT